MPFLPMNFFTMSKEYCESSGFFGPGEIMIWFIFEKSSFILVIKFELTLCIIFFKFAVSNSAVSYLPSSLL